jgi:hypothetical protein
VVSLASSPGGYINGRHSANLELLIDKTSSIYLYVKLKALASWIVLSFTSFWGNSDSYEYKNKSARRGTQFVPSWCNSLLSQIRVITKLPNSEQSYKGKVKTHNYINRQNQSTTGKLRKRNDPDLVQAFLKKWWVESNFKAPNLPQSWCNYLLSQIAIMM